MNRLRTRLVLTFLAATALPLMATYWVATSLLEYSLNQSATNELDQTSTSLEAIAREYYQQTREVLRTAALSGKVAPETFLDAKRSRWPAQVALFDESTETDRFVLSGNNGDHLDYLVRTADGINLFRMKLRGTPLEQITAQYRQARAVVEESRARDLRRGVMGTLLILGAVCWVGAMGSMVFLAARISRPIQQLTSGLEQLASGNLDVRLQPNGRTDEIGRALQAFNHTASELQQSRNTLIHLTQIASWQTLAQKMAHELKNSLTPIRLTVEEMRSRQGRDDREFTEQAVQIVVDEVESLRRRVRAFSEFSSEPELHPATIDVHAVIRDRVQFLQLAHGDITYEFDFAAQPLLARADPDHVRGILTNLLENAAEAAGQGRVLVTTAQTDRAIIEVHDSGPGLGPEALRTLFEPTISFKTHGMGLGLSIAKKSAVANGGDLTHISGRLGGAAFRLTLPLSDPTQLQGVAS